MDFAAKGNEAMTKDQLEKAAIDLCTQRGYNPEENALIPHSMPVGADSEYLPVLSGTTWVAYYASEIVQHFQRQKAIEAATALVKVL